ncbi:MAG: hypothetical protein Q4E59_05265 [Bacteroidales bacterium]|nr:hypothetical protein [Bacteroidales bacterium]
MDYKYIEQLLERYWECETTVEEENILRTFFSQTEVPESLAKYKDLFVYEQQQAAQPALSEDFDERVCRLAGADSPKKVVRARRVTFTSRLRPLYHAAASVAIVVLLGTAAQHVFNNPDAEPGWDYNANTYKDSYDNPAEAYETLSDGIQELQNVLRAPSDTCKPDTARDLRISQEYHRR